MIPSEVMWMKDEEKQRPVNIDWTKHSTKQLQDLNWLMLIKYQKRTKDNKKVKKQESYKIKMSKIGNSFKENKTYIVFKKSRQFLTTAGTEKKNLTPY